MHSYLPKPSACLPPIFVSQNQKTARNSHNSTIPSLPMELFFIWSARAISVSPTTARLHGSVQPVTKRNRKFLHPHYTKVQLLPSCQARVLLHTQDPTPTLMPSQGPPSYPGSNSYPHAKPGPPSYPGSSSYPHAKPGSSFIPRIQLLPSCQAKVLLHTQGPAPTIMPSQGPPSYPGSNSYHHAKPRSSFIPRVQLLPSCQARVLLHTQDPTPTLMPSQGPPSYPGSSSYPHANPGSSFIPRVQLLPPCQARVLLLIPCLPRILLLPHGNPGSSFIPRVQHLTPCQARVLLLPPCQVRIFLLTQGPTPKPMSSQGPPYPGSYSYPMATQSCSSTPMSI